MGVSRLSSNVRGSIMVSSTAGDPLATQVDPDGITRPTITPSSSGSITGANHPL